MIESTKKAQERGGCGGRNLTTHSTRAELAWMSFARLNASGNFSCRVNSGVRCLLMFWRGFEMLKKSRTLFLLIIFCIASPAYSQQRDFNVYDAGNIPRLLQAHLKERLDLFIEYQCTKQWDKVSNLLGEFYGSNRKRFTPRVKRELIGYISNQPMLNFTLKKIFFITEILGKPLSKKWWSLLGTAEYDVDGQSVQKKTILIAYRYKGDWYFSY
jgi:hypothetical protein